MRLTALFSVAVGCTAPSPNGETGFQRHPGADRGDTATDPGAADDLELRLRWVPTPGGLSPAERDAGLAWSLSLLGAQLPEHQADWLSDSDGVVLLDLGAVGFPLPARRPVAHLVEDLRTSDAYRQNGALDLARFLMRSLYEPWWYYAITGACPTLDDWTHTRRRSPGATYGVTASLLVDADRLVSFNAPPYREASEIALQIQTFPEGLGTDAPEAETLDLMGSGQQRFAIYGSDGQLVAGADPAVLGAGQPGKCMWCHEGSLQAGTPDNPHSSPHLDYEGWMSTLNEMNASLAAHRADLHGIDFGNPQVHTWSEWLIHELLRPTPARVAAEWGVDETEVLDLIADGSLSHGPHAEWPERGTVLVRTEVDAQAALRGAPHRLSVLPDERDAGVALDARPDRPRSVPAPGCW